MKATRPQLEKALKTPGSSRLVLLHGPDEAGSQALAKRVGAALGPDAERISLSGSDLKNDPARLADEAAALSMFGGARWILVWPAGDESLDAASALLDAGAAGNPVVLVAGALKSTSKLLKLVTAASNALAFASYPPDARDLVRGIVETARARGLALDAEDARRIADATAGNRAMIDNEVDKLALYLDAMPGQAVQVDHGAMSAVVLPAEEGDTAQLIESLFSGDARKAGIELGRLHAEGVEGITLVRAALRRSLMLARMRAQVEQGKSPQAVVDAEGRALFWKEKDAVTRQIGTWNAATLARCTSRLLAAEQAVKKSAGIGSLAVDAELIAIARAMPKRA